jgi:hypothetical protein
MPKMMQHQHKVGQSTQCDTVLVVSYFRTQSIHQHSSCHRLCWWMQALLCDNAAVLGGTVWERPITINNQYMNINFSSVCHLLKHLHVINTTSLSICLPTCLSCVYSLQKGGKKYDKDFLFAKILCTQQ